MQRVIDRIDAVAAGDFLDLTDGLWNDGHAALTLLGPGVEKEDFSDALVL